MRPEASFIEQPVRSLQTMLRVISQDDSRYPAVIPDGIYGPNTMHAVTTFQRLNGLPVSGVTDQLVWEQIVRTYEDALIRVDRAEPIEILLDRNQTLYPGDSNPYIYLAQSMLTQLSQDHPSIPAPTHNGILDPQTVNSISAFQELAGLTISGNIDRLTWKHLVHQFTLNAHHNNAVKLKY